MTKKRRDEIAAGLFILVATTLFFAILFMMGTFQNFFRSTREVEVVFEDVQGLRGGDPVYFIGAKVGSVRDVKFISRPEPDPQRAGETVEMSRVLVTLALPEKHWNRLKKDSRVLVDRSITGNLEVRISEGWSEDFLRKFDEKIELRGDVVFDMEETTRELSDALAKANSILTELAAILENLRESGHLQTIFQDIADTAKNLKIAAGPVVKQIKEITADVHGILGENRANIKSAVENISRSTVTLKDFIGRRLKPAADSLDSALKQAGAAARSFNGVVSRNTSRVNQMVESLNRSATSAETLIGELRRRPWRLLYEPSPEELETLGLYDAVWAYNLSATALDHSVTELAALSQTMGTAEGAIEEATVRRAVDQVEANLTRHREKEEAFYTLLRARVQDQ